jgi:TatD family-associated radical SAM protein
MFLSSFAACPTVSQQIAYRIDGRLYLNITDRCTLSCAFCPKSQGSWRVHEYDLRLTHRPDVEEILAAVGDPRDYEQIVFCGYGEPTLRLKTLLAVARTLKQQGSHVRVNTDGLANLVHKRNVLPELSECVDALSVSLNAQNAEVYNRHCRPALPGSYEQMLAFLREAPRWIASVSASAIDGLEGVDNRACEHLAHELGVEFRRRELDRVG